jgi:deazaflavin-dependent oxidoreductase (nitroreductase family)
MRSPYVTNGAPVTGTKQEAMRLRRLTADRLRAMYARGRGNREARQYARIWTRVIGLGVLPRRWVVLEVPGRRTGKPTRFPLGLADVDEAWFVVSMLGENCNWVRNVRAADGSVVLRRRRARRCRLVEVPVAERAPILRRYVKKVPGGRRHIPVPVDAVLSDFAAVADRYPVFRVTPD